MKKCIFALVVLLFVGCSDSKRTVSQSKVESIAEKWSTGDDTVLEDCGRDAWGNKITFKIETDSYSEHIQVRSNGFDGLPFTDDDIVAKRLRKIKPAKDIIEDLTHGASKGVVTGIKDGLKKKE